MRATAASYVISPVALAAVAARPGPLARPAVGALAAGASPPGWSATSATLITGAAKARKRVATFAIDGEVRFASAADRAAFAEELAGAVTALVSQVPRRVRRGRPRPPVVVAVHPSIDQGDST